MKDSIVNSVLMQFKERSSVGIEKYGTTLDRQDLSTLEWLKHLQEELMDATLYIEKLKQEYENNWKIKYVSSNTKFSGRNLRNISNGTNKINK